MSAVNNARLFVNTIVSRYDTLCHPGTAKIPDIFNPGLDEGLKEESLDYFSERFSTPPAVVESDPPQPMTIAQLNEEVAILYKTTAPNLSNLLALTGMLDASLQEPARQKIQSHIVEVLVQDHLRNKQGYELDPMAAMMFDIGSLQAGWQGIPEPILQFANGKSHFYSQIFLETYGRSRVRNKKKIVALLENFQPQLESYSFRFQRLVFKIEGAFNRIITDKNVKFGFSVALGIGSYFAVNKMIALSGVFFNSAVFAQMSSGVVSYMPAQIVQISTGAYNRLVKMVVYAASTRLYGLLFDSGKSVPIIIIKLMPLMAWVFYPVGTFAGRLQAICYQWSFGPSARVQEAIAESLKTCNPEDAKELLEEGMKAYQIWMHLVEQGPQKGLFDLAK
jgi:hypothetical protein